MNALANSYALSGQPAKAMPLFFQNIAIRENRKENDAIGLGNVACMAQTQIGQLSAAAVHLQKRIALCQEVNEEFSEAIGYRELGRISAYQSKLSHSFRKANGATADDELTKSTAYWEKTNDYQGLSLDSAYRSLCALLQTRVRQVANFCPTSGKLTICPTWRRARRWNLHKKQLKLNIHIPEISSKPTGCWGNR